MFIKIAWLPRFIMTCFIRRTSLILIRMEALFLLIVRFVRLNSCIIMMMMMMMRIEMAMIMISIANASVAVRPKYTDLYLLSFCLCFSRQVFLLLVLLYLKAG